MSDGLGWPGDQETEVFRTPPTAGFGNEISGVIHGPAVQARDIHGNVHLHQPVPNLPPPSQLPPPVHLVGRTADLAAMDAARAGRLLVVSGPPGIGKTALAVGWAHRVRGGFPDGVLFEDVHGFAPDGPARPSDVLGRFLRALGIPSRQVPTELAELAALYRSLTADRRMLVVLDDVLTAAQVVPLLPPSATSVAVVTSRQRLSGLVARGARIVQLDGLGADAAIELLGRTLGDDRTLAEPHAARALVDLCARVPLAVCVAGARLAARSRWSIGEMVRALEEERRRLAALAMEDDMAVRPALDISYRSLEPGAAQMYRVMGLFPGSRFGSGVAAAAVLVPQAEARRLLDVLTDANLLDDAEGGRYRFHDLTRLHAREMAEHSESAPARDIAVRRMMDWFLAAVTSAGQSVTPYRHDQCRDIRHLPAEPVRFPDPGSALDWLDRELPEVIAAARFAAGHGLPATAWQLADAMWPLFLYRGRYTERLEFDRLGLNAARTCGDLLGEAKMLSRIGMAALDLGRLDEAEAYFQQALRAWERMGSSDRAAGCLRRLGFVAVARNSHDDAVGYLTRALSEYRALGNSRHVALTLSDLGDVLTGMDRPREAITGLAEASSLLAGAADPYNQARVLIGLGRALQQAGELTAADENLRHALRSMREIGSSRGEAAALTALGDLAEHSGQRGEARRRYADAQKILVRIGSPRAAQVGERLTRLGDPAGP
jgi:tetratricopeptide (TPR) repeat protein